MLQRIQTLYLLGALAMLIWCAFAPVGRWVLEDGAVMIWGNSSYLPLLTLIIATAALQLPSIMLYRHRLLQVRISIFSCLLLVGWYAILLCRGYLTHSVLASDEQYVAGLRFVPQWQAALPALSIILLIAAIRAIMRDEMLVKSLDRLR